MVSDRTSAAAKNEGGAVPHAVAAYRAALPPGERIDFPITAIDRLGVPTWSATYHPAAGPWAGGVGYGANDDAAIIGAWGELSEGAHIAAALRRAPRRHASYRELRAAVGARGVVDPVTLCLPAGSTYDPDQPLTWVPLTRWATGEAVLVPIEFVAAQPSDLGTGGTGAPLVTPITNGLGAGPTLEHALGHGLLELVQRDGNSVVYRALARDTVLDLAGVADPTTRALLARLDAAGVDVLAKPADSDLGLANLYVVGADRDPEGGNPLMAAACGEAAHPDREVALQKAVLEFAASRARLTFTHGPLDPVETVAPPAYRSRFLRDRAPDGEEGRALRAMIAWCALPNGAIREALSRTVLAAGASIPFAALPTAAEPPADRAALARLVVERLAAAGLDVLYADLSPPGAPEVRVIKAIVSGLEVETMSYGRIGPRNLRRLLAQGSELVGLGAPPTGALPVLLTDADREALGGPAWLDPAAIDRTVGPLYVLYREPGRHAAPLALARQARG